MTSIELNYILRNCSSSYLDTRFGSLQPAFHLKADHAAELLHLALGDVVSPVRLESRVVDTQNLEVCFQVLGEPLSSV